MISTVHDTRKGGPITLAVTSGKGGVGKTNIVVNLAVALARLHNRVGILDADFALGNVDVLLGLAPAFHLGHLLSGEKDIHQVVVEGPYGIRLVPASSGLRELAALTPRQWEFLVAGLTDFGRSLDFLLIDTGAGISGNVLDVLGASERVLVATSPEPTAIVDAYAMIKTLTTRYPSKEVGLLVNGVSDADEAEVVFRQLDIAATRFLHRRLKSFGFVPHDAAVREAILMQRAVVAHAPQAPASQSFRQLASRVAALAPLGGPGLRLVPVPEVLRASLAEMEAPQCA